MYYGADEEMGSVIFPVAKAFENVSNTAFQLNVDITAGSELLTLICHPAISPKLYNQVDPDGIHVAFHRMLMDCSLSFSHRIRCVL